MNKLKYIICMMSLLLGASAFAQDIVGMEEMSELAKQRAQQKVAQMNDNKIGRASCRERV